MSEKKGGFRGLWQSLRGGKPITTQEALTDFNLDIVKTRQLEDRIEEFREFNQYIQQVLQKETKMDNGEFKYVGDAEPEERLRFMLASVNGVNERIHRIAVPWLRAGDIGGLGARIIHDWSLGHSRTLIIINSMMRMIRTKQSQSREAKSFEIEKQTVAAKVEFYFDLYYMPAAQFIAGVAWKNADIAPDKVAMIQNMQPWQSGAPQPFRSGLQFGKGLNEEEK